MPVVKNIGISIEQLTDACLQKMDAFGKPPQSVSISWPPPGFCSMMRDNADPYVQQLKKGDACRIALLSRSQVTTPRQFVGRDGVVVYILEQKTKGKRTKHSVVMSLDACDNVQDDEETKKIIRKYYSTGNDDHGQMMMDMRLVVVRPHDIWPVSKANEYPEAFDHELAKAKQEQAAALQAEASKGNTEKERRKRAFSRDQKKKLADDEGGAEEELADDGGEAFSVDDTPFCTLECDEACADQQRSESMHGRGANVNNTCMLQNTAEFLRFFEK